MTLTLAAVMTVTRNNICCAPKIFAITCLKYVMMVAYMVNRSVVIKRILPNMELLRIIYEHMFPAITNAKFTWYD